MPKMLSAQSTISHRKTRSANAEFPRVFRNLPDSGDFCSWAASATRSGIETFGGVGVGGWETRISGTWKCHRL